MLSELTFTDLGIPFALFDAPVSEAAEYKGRGRCSLCSKAALHCFEAGIGDDVIVPCPRCAAEVGLDADARSGGTCPACGAGVGFPDLGDSTVLACYRCLRSGRLAWPRWPTSVYDPEVELVRPFAAAVSAIRHSAWRGID
jgi:hypothetical protein